MTDKRTITVLGLFGKDKKITRDDFVARWRSHATDLHNLMDFDRANEIVKEVEEAAGRKWDDHYARENGGK